MTLLAIAAFFAVAFVALHAVDRRYAAREAERLAGLRRLRDFRPYQPNGRKPRHLTSCPMHPMPGRSCVPNYRDERFCLWCGREIAQDGAA